VINDILRTRRLQQAGIDPQVVQRAGAPFIPVEPLGLVDRSAAGQVTKAQESNLVDALFIPFGVMLLMWMVIFLAAQPMMESVLEEKSQSIAEVLLGSVDTFQLLLGKLLGGVAGSLSVMAIYGLGAIGYAWHADYLHLVPLRVLPWFLVYQVLAVMLFGSVFMAVGSAVTQLKEAQSMLLPVWMVMMIPLFVWLQVVREPLGPLATWLSFFPPATPLVMVLRSAATASVPWWQQALGILVLLATTLLVVFLAARIFRIGFLARGKTPKLTELLRWALHG
jgi:ABC-type Na+ efflux pump permease subunit